MKEIGEKLKAAREEHGVSVDEAAEDLNLRASQIENIEKGNLKVFKDVFYLKSFIRSYAKYLGLDEDAIMDEFNEYFFEETSKIPIAEIEKASRAKEKEKASDKKVASPYTVDDKPKSKVPAIIVTLIILLLLFLNGEILTLVVFYIIVAFLWFGYSICVNNKVSTIVNELLSAALAILVLIKDLIVSALPTEILDVEYELPIIDNVYKYTGEQLFQLAFNCLVTPFLIINIIALLLCTVKGYWIDKYNDGKDITEDMLPDDIEQKDIIDVLFNRFIHRK